MVEEMAVKPLGRLLEVLGNAADEREESSSEAVSTSFGQRGPRNGAFVP